MWTGTALFRLMATSHLLLLAAALLRNHRRDRSAQASLAFIGAVVAHLIRPFLAAAHAPEALVQLAVLADLAVPFAFWILAVVHFEDGFRLRSVHWLVLALLEAVGYVSWLAIDGRALPDLAARPADRALWAVLPKLLSLAVVAHALVGVYVGCRSDLVVARLKARFAVLIASGTYLLLELASEAVLWGPEAQEVLEPVHDVTTFLLVFALSVLCVRTDPDVLKPMKPSAEAAAPDPRLAERLRHLLEVEEVFRREGLTIAALAEHLETHEYRVRQLINDQLGFRNFNAFLHHYRIREARRALEDPGKRHLSVAQIAYEVGYRSLGPFNKAFKEIVGRTPTDLRSLRLAEPASEGGGGAAPAS